jgi:hypothetical protein
MRTDSGNSSGSVRQTAASSRRMVAGLAVAGVLTTGIFVAGCSGSGTRAGGTANAGTAAAVSAAITSTAPAGSATSVAASSATSAAATPANGRMSQATAGSGGATPQPGAASPTPAAAGDGISDRRAALQSILQKINAATIVAGFKKRGLPVGSSTTLTATTDPDGQLGKPGQYTSKVTFVDSRLAGNGATGIAAGGAVEVFSTTADAARRKQELSRAATANGTAGEIEFQRGTIVLRLSPQLAADQISEYESTVNLVLKAALKQAARHSPATATPSAAGGSSPQVPARASATPSPTGR